MAEQAPCPPPHTHTWVQLLWSEGSFESLIQTYHWRKAFWTKKQRYKHCWVCWRKSVSWDWTEIFSTEVKGMWTANGGEEVRHLTGASHSMLSISAADKGSSPEFHVSLQLPRHRSPLMSVFIIPRRCWHPKQVREQQLIMRNLEVKPMVPQAASDIITSYLPQGFVSRPSCVRSHKTKKRLWELNPTDLIYKINGRTKLKQKISAFKNSFSDWVSLGRL